MQLSELEYLCINCMQGITQNGVCPLCGFVESNYTPSLNHLLPRTILAGKYMLGKVLGEGGFGITYLGIDLNLDFRVAIKEYYPSGFVSRESHTSSTIMPFQGEKHKFFQKGKDGFINEAKNLAKYRNMSGIVSVNDFFLENETAYIVMEFIDGITFKAYCASQGGKLPPDQVFGMLNSVITSLAEVHRSGMIHRDISPDNIMCTADGQLKLLDFGAARSFVGGDNKSLSVMLKPGYAPEEQYRSKGQQGPWTDVYSMCGTIYKALTGITPDEASERLVEDTLKPPSALGIAINPQLEQVLMHGLATRHNNRIQSMDQLLAGFYGHPSPGQAHNSSTQPLYSPHTGYQNNQEPFSQAPMSQAPLSQQQESYHPGHDDNRLDKMPAKSAGKSKSKAITIGVIAALVAAIIIVIAAMNSRYDTVEGIWHVAQIVDSEGQSYTFAEFVSGAGVNEYTNPQMYYQFTDQTQCFIYNFGNQTEGSYTLDEMNLLIEIDGFSFSGVYNPTDREIWIYDNANNLRYQLTKSNLSVADIQLEAELSLGATANAAEEDAAAVAEQPIAELDAEEQQFYAEATQYVLNTRANFEDYTLVEDHSNDDYAYFDGDELKTILLPPETDDQDFYAYHFRDGALLYAKFTGTTDADEIYFDQGQILTWNYYPDKNDTQYQTVTTEEMDYDSWADTIIADSSSYEEHFRQLEQESEANQQAYTFIFDQINLLSYEQIIELEHRILSMVALYNAELIFVFANDIPDGNIEAYINNQLDLGNIGSKADGIIFGLNTETRQYATISYGFAQDINMDQIIEVIMPLLQDDDYYSACDTLLTEIELAYHAILNGTTSSGQIEEEALPIFSMDQITYIGGTSSLTEGSVTHSSDRILDGDHSTAWSEGVAGNGYGEGITLNFADTFQISGLYIRAGYHKSSNTYYNNGRPSQLTFTFSDGSTETHRLADIMESQLINFNQPRITSSLTMTIDDVYPGSTYQDTLITEIYINN